MKEGRRVYLDHNATTPVAPEVIDGMAAALRETCANPSSVHQDGQRAKGALEEARAAVAKLLSGQAREVYFTSGGTEANNIALFSYLKEATPSNRREVLVTPGEHPSIRGPLGVLERSGAITVKEIPLAKNGALCVEAIPEILTDATALVCVMLTNNETGNVYPLEKIVEMCRRRNPYLPVHCDAIQAVGRIPVSVAQLGVDSLSLSGHKFYGPKGVGALWIQHAGALPESFFVPRQFGGGQEGGMRAGTENLPGIIGMGLACRLSQESMTAWRSAIEPLRDHLEAEAGKISFSRINGQGSPRIYSTSNLHFEGVPADLLHQALDLEGFSVSTGSACSSGTVRPSPVLRALGQSEREAAQAIRVSLGKDTTRGEIDDFCAALSQRVRRIREML